MSTDHLPAVIGGKHLRRTAHVYPRGRNAAPVPVLDPTLVGTVLAYCWRRDGLRVAVDLDGFRYLVSRDETGEAWRVLGRVDGLSAAQSSVRALVDALPDPPSDAERDVVDAYAATRTMAENGSRGWGFWCERVADEALAVLLDVETPVAYGSCTPAPRQAHTGPRASTVAARERAEIHADLFLASIPPTAPLRSEVWRQYLSTAMRSGVRSTAALRKSALFDRLAERATVTRRSHGVIVAVPAPDLPTAEEEAERAAVLARTRAALAARPRPTDPSEEPAL